MATRSHCLDTPAASVDEAASQLVGLHNTTQFTPYLSVRARLPGFTRPQLEGSMYDSWQLVRFRAMRLTMFVFPLEILPIAASAMSDIGSSLLGRWQRESGITEDEYERLALRVVEALKAGPLTTRALRKRLEVPGSVDLAGVVGRMCDSGRLVGGRPPRNWRSSVRQYHLWEQVLPGVKPLSVDRTEAQRDLIVRYIQSYGPVTLDDVTWWTGLPKELCRAAVDASGDRVARVEVDGWRGPHLVVDGIEGSEPDSVLKALPLLDPYVQGYRDRSRFLDAERHEYVYDRGGNSAATLVHRGRIIGVWQPSEDPAPSVRYHLFQRSPASVRKAAESELAAAGAMYHDQQVDVIEVAEMKPLADGGGRSAMHPLDDRIHRASRRS